MISSSPRNLALWSLLKLLELTAVRALVLLWEALCRLSVMTV